MYEILEPPVDDEYYLVEQVINRACHTFLDGKGFGVFEDLYDHLFEQVRENINKYIQEEF